MTFFFLLQIFELSNLTFVSKSEKKLLVNYKICLVDDNVWLVTKSSVDQIHRRRVVWVCLTLYLRKTLILINMTLRHKHPGNLAQPVETIMTFLPVLRLQIEKQLLFLIKSGFTLSISINFLDCEWEVLNLFAVSLCMWF